MNSTAVQISSPSIIKFNASKDETQKASAKNERAQHSIKPDQHRAVPKRVIKSDVATVPEENHCDDDTDEDEPLEMKQISPQDDSRTSKPSEYVSRNPAVRPTDLGASSPLGSVRKLVRSRQDLVPLSLASNGGTLASSLSSPNFKREHSMRSLKNYHHLMSDIQGGHPSSFDSGYSQSKPLSDVGSVRSWASVGMGSTDGKKMIVRRVPTSPVELFNIVNPPTPPEEYIYDDESGDATDDDEDSVYIKPRRQHWSNKLQFVLACVGYSVGLGSIWRFPYLCYKSGGAVFLIPYAIIMIFIGGPMLYMELAVGQFTGRGPIGALGHLCPLFKGAGLGSVVISFLISTYYSVIIAYGVYYFFTSFRSKEPWDDCSHIWNTPYCWVPSKSTQNITKPMYSHSPAEEFYDRKVLQIGRGIEDFGIIRWELITCLICAWILIYFGIWKSIKSSAKVRYFTATFPFIIIIVLLIKSLTLDGADKGMRYFFKPKFELLLDAKVWVNAASQTFNSMGCAFGSMISFASYNKYDNNIMYDTIAVWLVNAITSLLVGIFAFATIGNIALEQGTSIEDVIDDGPGLIFVVYPQTMAKMPSSQLWAVFFFFMLICLALNSQFAIVEVVLTSIQDGFPAWIKRNLMCHEVLALIICFISFLCGIPNVTQGGIYFFQLIDHYAASISIMYLAFFECVAITWFYGTFRLCRNVKTMTGRHPGWFLKICWLVITPLMIFALWVFLIIDYEPPTYNNGNYHYPGWAIAIGWIIASLSILCIPAYMIVIFVRSPGSTFLVKLKNSLKSDLDDKCPKGCESDCDCALKEEDCNPMLVMQGPADLRDDRNLQSTMYTALGQTDIVTNNRDNGSGNPNAVSGVSDDVSEYDNVNNRPSNYHSNHHSGVK
ncbi:sodium- and chloride-dependent GABA transporter ine-like [Cylas formicarius]|uniref:sodium- and chloride-dependent GABA transporter ine-like n=1 Tax=Cylas formicarius TaxID=197179 RepID=UPI0029587F29|nr:sodium- and chloride-dependent GABA transporter ine-like [Cylas formicarius]XP_060527838.1 sodium- and chloride-dependent GABA transporter ine-like [Cylas formicarius]XP_060527839.1 sodium- and chloride-dependent GABA transporter ine-like [Cylas formicarius]XP_060527840.1 sodium- and chloride-dependent GABA transporter ine-like [Cylas formicarius]XP_060527841.1 sodium- and chloride-dependent GABA transporter ine-like [Cylas formicarius]XP_060527842.1 sodium- and chloride-dependent GABA tran